MGMSGLLDLMGINVDNLGITGTWLALLKTGIIVVLAVLAFFLLSRGIPYLIYRLMRKTHMAWGEIIYKERFFSKLSYLVAPLTAKIILNSDLFDISKDFLGKLISIWLVIAFVVIINAFLNTINKIYESYPISRDRPITVFIQVIKIFIVLSAIVVMVSVLFGINPTGLLASLSAITAVLMLVFKDSILGFVAGIQLMGNSMVRIGDWIEMPSMGVDGEVLEINLTTVKVKNWNLTISTIPTYELVSKSFMNWRGMEESTGRRIKRYVNIDIAAVHFLSEKEIEKFRNSDLLKDYINKTLPLLEGYNQGKDTVLDEHKLTNLGVFRQYMEMWLDANPNINKNLTCMVRQLQPTATGIPIEIYCFSAKQQWVDYERVQSDVFDHMLAVIPHFNLKVFQYPTDKLVVSE